MLSISPVGEPLPPRRAGGRFESPVRYLRHSSSTACWWWCFVRVRATSSLATSVCCRSACVSSDRYPLCVCFSLSSTQVTFVWTLDKPGAAGAAIAAGAGSLVSSSSYSRRSSLRSPSPVPPPPSGSGFPRLPPSRPPTTSVHLAQWQSEQRARDEVLVRVKGQPRVKLNRVFEVRWVLGVGCWVHVAEGSRFTRIRASRAARGEIRDPSFSSFALPSRRRRWRTCVICLTVPAVQ